MDKLWFKARRVLSVLLAFAMLASITPVQAFAEDTAPAETSVTDTAVETDEPSGPDETEQAPADTENSVEKTESEEETPATPAPDAAAEDAAAPEVTLAPTEDPAAVPTAAPTATPAPTQTPQAVPEETPAADNGAEPSETPAANNAAAPVQESDAAEPDSQPLTASVDGMTVTVAADLPDDTQVVVTKMSGNDLGDDNMEALMEAVNSNDIREIEVYDITLTNAQGNEYTLPRGQSATVTLSGISLQAAEGQTLYAAHLKADGSADMGDIDGNTVTFTVDSFSPFVVAAVGSAETGSETVSDDDPAQEELSAAPEEADEVDGTATYSLLADTYADKANYFINSTTDPHVHIYYSVDGQTILEIPSGATIALPEINRDAIKRGIVGIEFYIVVDQGYTYGKTTFTGKQDGTVLDIDDSSLRKLSASDWFAYDSVDFDEAIRKAKDLGAVKAFMYQDNGLSGGSVGTRTFAVSTDKAASFATVTYHNTQNNESKTYYLEKGTETTTWDGVDISLNWTNGNDNTHLVGWSTTSGGSKEYGLSVSFTPTQDLDLYTVWEKNSYAYTVRYYYDGDEGTAPAGAETSGTAGLDETVKVSPATTVQVGDTQYALDSVNPENGQIKITADEDANVISVYYCTDANGDGKPDKDQTVTLTFQAGENGSLVVGDAKKESQTYTLLPGSKYPEVGTDFSVEAESGWCFTGWTPDYDKTGTVPANAGNENVTYTATYEKDDNGDGKPDKYQIIAILENRTQEYTGATLYGYGSTDTDQLTFKLANGESLPGNVQVMLNNYQEAEGTDVGNYPGNADGATVTVLVNGQPDTRYSLLRVEGGSLTVTAKPLNVTVSFQDRVYEKGNTTVQVAGASIAADQVIEGDDVTVTATGFGTIATAFVQDNAAVSSQVQPLLSGADAGNYTLGTVSYGTVNILGVVTYDTNAGDDDVTWEKPEEKQYHYEDTVTLPENEPTRYGYAFLGWSVNEDAEEADTSFTMGSTGLKLYAVWQAKDVTVTVNYHYGSQASVTGNVPGKKFDETLTIGTGSGDLSLDAKTVYEGAAYTLSSVEMGSETLFTLNAGNYQNPTFNDSVKLDNLTLTVDVYYVADNGGDGIPDQYQVTVHYAVAKGSWNDGGDAVKSETVTLLNDNDQWDENGSAKLTDIPAVGEAADTGYTAGSWDSDPSAAAISSGDKDKTFTYTYAVDADQQYTVTYTAQANGTVSPASEEAQVLGTTGLQGSAATPANGYVFDGWYMGDSKISSDAVLSAETVAANLNKTTNAHGETVYVDTEFSARFTIRTDLSYTVRYLEDGTGNVLAGEKTVGGQTFGATVTETAPDIAGYTVTSDKNPQSLTIGTGDNVITFYYKAVGETVAATTAPTASPAPVTAPAATAPAAPTAPAATAAPAATTAPEEDVTEEPEEEIQEEETPLAPESGEEESIADEATPLAGSNASGWALLNLILAVLTALGGVLLALGYLLRRKSSAWNLAALIPAVGAVVAFLLTEDMSLKMAFVDKWTLLMVIIAVIQIVVAILGSKDKQDPDEEDETRA